MKVLFPLARGGMGQVLLVERDGGIYAVKRLREDLANSSDFVAMFQREADLQRRLVHPNIVRTVEVGNDESGPYVVMEYVEGCSLERILRASRSRRRTSGRSSVSVPMSKRFRSPALSAPPSEPSAPAPPVAKRLPLETHLRIVSEMLKGLHYAHELTNEEGNRIGLVHRDVTPHNIMVGYDGSVKLFDFGIAKVLEDEAARTKTGIFKGKISYLAPEQVFARELIDRRSDIFAVGAMLFEAATRGRRLWDGVADNEIFERLARGTLPDVREHAPEVNAKLAAVCTRCLAVERDERYPSAEAVRLELESVIAELGAAGVGTREVAEYVNTTFADARAEVRAAIEAGRRGSPPTSGSGRRITASSPGVTSARGVARSVQPPSGAPQPRGGRIIALGVVAAVALVTATTVGMRMHRADEVTAAPPPPPPPPRQVWLSLDTSPADAHVYIDDRELGVARYRGPVVADGRRHVIRAALDGFLPAAREVTFTGDHIDVSFVLERIPTSTATSTAPVLDADAAGPR